MTITETEVAQAVANAQNVPFVGPKQRRIAANIMPLIHREQDDNNDVIAASQSLSHHIANERDAALAIIRTVREYVINSSDLDAGEIIKMLNKADDIGQE